MSRETRHKLTRESEERSRIGLGLIVFVLLMVVLAILTLLWITHH